MANIGIGISTRNRPHVLETSLRHFREFTPEDVDIVVVDDNSPETAELNAEACRRHGAVYRFNERRLGIAKTKNRSLAELSTQEHVFMFDDDAFPKSKGWINCFVEPALRCGVHHSMLNTVAGDVKLVGKFREYLVFNQCWGVALHFTRKCLDAIGGYDAKFGIYGFEHAQMSHRAKFAGMLGNPVTPFLTPYRADEFIYALDFDLHWRKTPPPLGGVDEENFRSAIHGEPTQQYIEENYKVFQELRELYMPITWDV